MTDQTPEPDVRPQQGRPPRRPRDGDAGTAAASAAVKVANQEASRERADLLVRQSRLRSAKLQDHRDALAVRRGLAGGTRGPVDPTEGPLEDAACQGGEHPGPTGVRPRRPA